MLNLILHLLGTAFRSRRSLMLENIVLSHQREVLGRRKHRSFLEIPVPTPSSISKCNTSGLATSALECADYV